MQLGNLTVGLLQLLIFLGDPFLQLVRTDLARFELLFKAHDLLFTGLAQFGILVDLILSLLLGLSQLLL